jgi:hypothetical protein
MNRLNFLKKSLLGIAGVVAAKTGLDSIPTPPETPIPTDRPGIGGETFHVKLDKAWFTDIDHITPFIIIEL